MTNRTRLLQSALTVNLVCVCACSERTLDFESNMTASGGTFSQTSSGSGGGNGTTLAVEGGARNLATEQAISHAGMMNGTPKCQEARQLSVDEVSALDASSCNYWAVEAEMTQGTCRVELPVGLEPDRSNEPSPTPLLRFDDGRVTLLSNSTDPSCRTGFRFIDQQQIELDPEPCARLGIGDAILQLVFGCTAEDLESHCVPDRTLTRNEVASIQAAACNAWGIQPEGPLPESPCIWELPIQSGDGLREVDPNLTAPLLIQKDGSVVLLRNNTAANAKCASGFRFLDASYMQLNASACKQLSAGASLQITFGCTPDDLSDSTP